MCKLIQFETRNGNCRRCGSILPFKKAFLKTEFVDVYATVRTSVRAYREVLRLNAAELAAAGRVSRSAVCRLESGTALVGLSVVERIAEGLHVPLGWLFEAPTEERLAEVFAVHVLTNVRLYGTRKAALLYGIRKLRMHRIVERYTLKKAG